MNGEDRCESLRIDLGEKLGNSDITPQDLLDETIRPFIIEECRKTCLEKNHTVNQINIPERYKRSFFQNRS